jgi:glycosyltransferase involved in cell wall biosynthesis
MAANQETIPHPAPSSLNPPGSPAYELTVVIPVFNEEKNIGALLHDWQDAFRSIPVRCRFMIIDDGSTDNSLSILQSMTGQMPEIEVHTQPNAGHGPAILAGYRLALGTEWIFQIDSDHQHDPAVFATLWKNRNEYDFLLGERIQKNASLPRKAVSFVSTLIVRLFYERRSKSDSGHSSLSNKVKDVNSPYRLMHRALLKPAMSGISGNSFAPNVLLTAWFVFFKVRILTVPLSHRNGAVQRQSKMNFYFLRGCFQSIFQTISFRFRL